MKSSLESTRLVCFVLPHPSQECLAQRASPDTCVCTVTLCLTHTRYKPSVVLSVSTLPARYLASQRTVQDPSEIILRAILLGVVAANGRQKLDHQPLFFSPCPLLPTVRTRVLSLVDSPHLQKKKERKERAWLMPEVLKEAGIQICNNRGVSSGYQVSQNQTSCRLRGGRFRQRALKKLCINQSCWSS